MVTFITIKREIMERVRLGLTGVLNAEKWEALTDVQRRKFIEKHAGKVLPKLVKFDVKVPVSEELKRTYDVTARYTILDYHYNKRGEVTATLEWSRASGFAKLIDYNYNK